MRVLIPILSPQCADPAFVEAAIEGASVVYVLLVLDKDSPSSAFGFKASEIMQGRDAVERVKEKVKEHKHLCTDILEWGHVLEKTAQIAEMKQVDKIVLYDSNQNKYFEHTVKDLQNRTPVRVDVVRKK